MSLQKYWAKRDFNITQEPRGQVENAGAQLRFYIQKHHARNLHYDFRLEIGGTLKSWAVPKGPSLDPDDKRLAVAVEDHPLAYGSFEGSIPKGQYGAGHVILWDKGTWEAIGDAEQGLKSGSLKFLLHGHKLYGKWALVRMKGASAAESKNNWLLIKEKDAESRKGKDAHITESSSESVYGLPDLEKPTECAVNHSDLNAYPRYLQTTISHIGGACSRR
jgi:bifunctional non-homologous end joining protein LigD